MTDLSPATQAVLNAYRDANIDDEATAAAVLRAAVNQVIPVPIIASSSEEHWTLLGIKNRFLAMADELEGQ